MNTERTHAYGRVVKTLDELGPAKLQPAEQQRVREAADTLIFATDLEEARRAMADVDELAEHLLASDRWSEERARQLVDDLLACGPVTPLGQPARPPCGRGTAAAGRAAAGSPRPPRRGCRTASPWEEAERIVDGIERAARGGS